LSFGSRLTVGPPACLAGPAISRPGSAASPSLSRCTPPGGAAARYSVFVRTASWPRSRRRGAPPAARWRFRLAMCLWPLAGCWLRFARHPWRPTGRLRRLIGGWRRPPLCHGAAHQPGLKPGRVPQRRGAKRGKLQPRQPLPRRRRRRQLSSSRSSSSNGSSSGSSCRSRGGSSKGSSAACGARLGARAGRHAVLLLALRRPCQFWWGMC
jgi:hypothetical protein